MADREAVLVLTGNLFFMPRIEAAAEHFGMDVVQTSSAEALTQAAASRNVSLVLVDLEMEEGVWTAALTGLPAKNERSPKVVAYGPHGEPETLRKARDLGSDAVMIKRDFSERLTELMETRGAAVIP